MFQNATFKILCYALLARICNANSLQILGKHEFLTLLSHIRQERNYETLVIINKEATFAYLEELLQLELPLILLNMSSSHPQTRLQLDDGSLNHELLIIYLIKHNFQVSFVENFINFLGHLRSARIVFFWPEHYDEHIHQPALRDLFKHCQHNAVLNVISIFVDFAKTQNIYSYTQFPKFVLQARPNTQPYFPRKLINLQGAPLSVLPDCNEPRSMIYRDANGVVRITGYAAKIVQTFAQKHNMTITHPTAVLPGFLFRNYEMLNLTENNALDMVMGLLTANVVMKHNLQGCSVVVEQSGHRAIVPNAPPIPTYNIFPLIFNVGFVIIILLLLAGFSGLLTLKSKIKRGTWRNFFSVLSRETLRGVLGQTTSLCETLSFYKKYIYILLFLTGIYVNTIFSAFLNTYLTVSPRPKEINSFDDLLDSPIRIFALERSLKTLQQFTELAQKTDLFYITSNMTEFYEARKVLSPRYAYMMTDSLWKVVARQQEDFPRPFFHTTEKLYLTKSIRLCIPIYEHSIYREALNTLIRQIQESGLLEYWRNMAYDDMVTAGFVKVQKRRTVKVLHSLIVTDFYWIWWMYGFGVLMGFNAFLLEIIYYYGVLHRNLF